MLHILLYLNLFISFILLPRNIRSKISILRKYTLGPSSHEITYLLFCFISLERNGNKKITKKFPWWVPTNLIFFDAEKNNLPHPNKRNLA